MLPLFVLALLTAAPLHGDEASEARLKKDVTFLASDECEGRGVGTKGLDKAAEYVADQLARAGLKPGGTDGTFFQPFPMVRGSELDGPASLVLDGPLGQKITLKLGTDFQVSGLSGAGKVSAPVVFAGFGTTAKDIGYDDFAGLDVKGKVVLALRHVPRYSNEATPFDGPRKNDHAALDNKQALASVNGAAALILVNDAVELKAGDPLMSFQSTARAVSNFNLPYVQIRRTLAEEICASGLGQELCEIEQAINRDLKPRSAALKGWKATLDVNVKRNTVTVKNIIGVLEGSGPLAKETIVIGAHYDHLGFGGMGSRSPKEKAIHHGAERSLLRQRWRMGRKVFRKTIRPERVTDDVEALEIDRQKVQVGVVAEQTLARLNGAFVDVEGERQEVDGIAADVPRQWIAGLDENLRGRLPRQSFVRRRDRQRRRVDDSLPAFGPDADRRPDVDSGSVRDRVARLSASGIREIKADDSRSYAGAGQHLPQRIPPQQTSRRRLDAESPDRQQAVLDLENRCQHQIRH